jgi:hypothetical protein
MSPTNYFGDDDDPVNTWTLFQIYADLGSKGDIPKAIGCSPRQVYRWMDERDRYKIPLPVARIGHTDVYSMLEWQDWFERYVAEHPPENNYRPRRLGPRR